MPNYEVPENDYFKPHVGVSSYDDMLDNDPMGSYGTRDYYRFEKKSEYTIVMMTPKQYIAAIAKHVFGTTVERAARCDNSAVEKYADLFEQGSKAPLPYLNTRKGRKGQEGRHRMLAIQLLSERRKEKPPAVPVMWVYDAKFTDEEVLEYIHKKWGDREPSYWYKYITGKKLQEASVQGREKYKYVFKIPFRVTKVMPQTDVQNYYSLKELPESVSGKIDEYVEGKKSLFNEQYYATEYEGRLDCEKLFLYTPKNLSEDKTFVIYLVFMFNSPVKKSEVKGLKDCAQLLMTEKWGDEVYSDPLFITQDGVPTVYAVNFFYGFEEGSVKLMSFDTTEFAD